MDDIMEVLSYRGHP